MHRLWQEEPRAESYTWNQKHLGHLYTQTIWIIAWLLSPTVSFALKEQQGSPISRNYSILLLFPHTFCLGLDSTRLNLKKHMVMYLVKSSDFKRTETSASGSPAISPPPILHDN